MSPNRHSIAAVSTAKKLNTPLKASVVLLTSMILTACNTTDDPSYKLDDIFSPSQSVIDGQLKAEKEKAEKAKAEADAALAAKEKAEAALVAAEKAALEAKKESDAAIAAAEKAKKEAEDALASGGGGNKEELQKIADEKAKLSKEAQADADAAQTTANVAQQAAKDALAASQIKNAPEAKKTGVQHVSIDASGLGQGALTTTTRDFGITDATQVQARADIASGGLVSDPVALKVSGANDAAVPGSNGFKSFENTTKVVTASLGEQDLVYTSTYKDFGDDLRVAHIDGTAAGLLPVNGVAVVGNATQVINMPTEGKVGYTGDATYREIGLGKDIQFGTSVFTADFVAKNLKGDLTFSNKTIGLEAAISGNQFSGSKDGYNADGGFFGGDAQYLGGVYEGNGAQGTYGAKSNKQTQADKVANESADKAAAANKELADAQAAAAKAKKDAEKAQAAVDNAGNSGNGQALQDALDKLELAEAAAKKAQEDAEAAIKEAADKAQEEIKAAQDKVAAAQSETATAKAAVATAEAKADEAEKDAATKIAAAESAAGKDVAAAQAAADKAIANAAKAREDLLQAQADKLTAEQRANDLQKQLDALNNPDAYKSDAEAGKSGVQVINVDASGASLPVFEATTRDFEINEDGSILNARADTASGNVLPIVPINISGEGDTDTKNGFKAHEDNTSIAALGQSLPLAYTAIYKDFGADMRIAHINGEADGTAAIGTMVPVDGVAVVGNKTLALPTEGTFEYAGDATNRKVGVDNAVEYGSSEFTADFVNKKVDGTLKFAQAGQIDLSANIAGNEFSGAAADNTGYNSEGAFYGKDANFIGGIYEGNGSQGTFGAEKDGTAADLIEPAPELPPLPDNPDVGANLDATGIMSNTLSSVKGIGSVDAIGFRQFVTDTETYEETTGSGEGMSPTIIKGDSVDNLTYNTIKARLDIVKPNKFNLAKQDFTLQTVRADDIAVAGSDGFMKSAKANEKLWDGINTGLSSPLPETTDLALTYQSVYKNFDSQMQIGHVYGDLAKRTQPLPGVKSRLANVYVVGNSTAQADMTYMEQLSQYNIDNGINDGIVNYTGVATYADNLHLGSNAPMNIVLNGTSAFDVNFVNKSLTGNLAFADDKNIGITADISGNTFAGTNKANNVATAGGFYGKDAKFLGGIYQEALNSQGSDVPGTGTTPVTGTTFQGTFGAEKQ